MSRRTPDLDALLSGGDRSEHDMLAAVLRAAAESLPAAPSPPVAEQHLAAITAEAATHARAEPGRSRAGRAGVWRRRAARLAGATAVKVGFGVGVAAAATGGLAAAGSLPPAAQSVVSELVERVGIELPRPDAAPRAGDTPTSAETTVPGGAPRGDDERGVDPRAGTGDAPASDVGRGAIDPVDDRPAADAPSRGPATGAPSEAPAEPARERDDDPAGSGAPPRGGDATGEAGPPSEADDHADGATHRPDDGEDARADAAASSTPPADIPAPDAGTSHDR